MATTDIEFAHGQERIDEQTPWNFGNEMLRQIAVEQCIFLMQAYEIRISRAMTRANSISTFSDGVRSGIPNGENFGDSAKNLMKLFLIRNGLLSKKFERG